MSSSWLDLDWTKANSAATKKAAKTKITKVAIKLVIIWVVLKIYITFLKIL